MNLTGWNRFCLTVILTCGALASSYFVATYMFSIPVGQVLIIMLGAVAVSAAMLKPVGFLKRWLHIPRTLSILLIYACFFALVTWASVRAQPVFTEQVKALAADLKSRWMTPSELMTVLPHWMTDLLPQSVVEKLSALGQDKIGDLSGQLTTLALTVSGFVGTVLAAGMNTILLLLFAFFLTRREGLVSSYLSAPIANETKRLQTKQLIDHMMVDLGQWANAQLVIGAFFGSAFGSLLSLAGIPYGFTIGLVGFLGESLIPMGGSIFTLALLAVPVGLAHGGPWGMTTVLIIYGVVFLLEWHVVYLFVMGRALKFDACITLFFMWIGYFPMGITGSVLVLPIMVIGFNLLKFVCPHLAEEGEPSAPAHSQVLQTLLKRAGFDPEIPMRRHICHRLFGTDLHTPIYRQAFRAVVRRPSAPDSVE